MTPVDQTRFSAPGPDDLMSEPPGNCWAACIASLLNLSLQDLPDEALFWRPGMKPLESWRPFAQAMFDWLLPRGVSLVSVPVASIRYEGTSAHWGALHYICSGPSPRHRGDYGVFHAVIARGNEIVHDPHPSRAGLAGDPGKWSAEFLVRV